MHKVFLLAMAVVWLAACSMSSHVDGGGNRVAVDTTQVVDRVNEIYADVFHYYEYLKSPRSKTQLTGIKPPAVKFCSHDWNELVTQVTTHDATSLNEGEMGFFDADYWIMGQDWGDLAVSDVHVSSMSDSVATVMLSLHNLGNVTTVRLEMVRERESWRIDNFIDVTNGIDWKASMEEYLTNIAATH